MDRFELKGILKEILMEEGIIGEIDLANKWLGGKVILKPKDSQTQSKEIPIDVFFHKIVMVRDRLRVLEQKINANQKLNDDEKVDIQQYITKSYGSLTTFNVLFRDKNDGFIGQKV